jgi:glycosyltransferase involved in cell wall biosynthesis
VRILLVSHAPLSEEFGASQMALNLAEALRARGHEAFAWSPEPLPPGSRWSQRRRQKRAIEAFAENSGPFDVIDSPPTTVSRKLARLGGLVARSIQPELRYVVCDLAYDLRRRRSPRVLAHAVSASAAAAAVVAGWRRAGLILCLGSGELAWMWRHFPRWRSKLRLYLNATPPGERSALAEVRRLRPETLGGEGIRFLWIGRWSAHKGIERLRRFLADRLAAFPNDTVTLAGCGVEAEQDLAREWTASGRVRVMPRFARTDLPLLLVQHDAGLFTSEVEGWGLSLCEMLESGMPVFATEAGAVPDLRPYFPDALRPFPPPSKANLDLRPLEDLAANGYFARFTWHEVARCYESEVLRWRRSW